MGNIVFSGSCFVPTIRKPQPVKLVYWGGATELLPAAAAGEVLFRHPDRVVCPADSFFVGRPVPALSIEDPLLAGGTYVVLPLDRLPSSSQTLTVSSLASLFSSKPSFAGSAFEYVKAKDGRTVIKVRPEFIVGAITSEGVVAVSGGCGGSQLCTTPELRKRYEQLVSPNARAWSPKLETISEKKARVAGLLSPSRLSPARLCRWNTR